MPASRGIMGPLTVRHSVLAALCLQALPRGSVEFGHALTGLREESDGVTLRFQVQTPPRPSEMHLGIRACMQSQTQTSYHSLCDRLLFRRAQ